MQHPKPFDGQRHELFSMLAVAASHDMGMALIPQMLIESELQKKELVIVSNKKLKGSRSTISFIRAKTSHRLFKKFVEWIYQELEQLKTNTN
ncbi:hypothetical protein [Pseudomonas aeruginosa]|uniref:hypothetical protein n=1 Tax=Pseudomonas aeruginosa TaxID=287 RepID=UPI00255A8587|nr:hypothetical protein [Pseudomonas aeruginosa]MDL4524036.1 hypothetical protein [Pseudomonas aeruginosa]